MKIKSKPQILERRKEIEQELLDMLKETESDFTLDHVRDVIFHEEDNDDMMKVVAMFDRGGDASELSNVLELVTDAWNYFPHKVLGGISPAEKLLEHHNKTKLMKINNTFKLIIAIIVSELAGIIGSVFTTPSIAGWYAGIAKPALNPPAWVFGPVWTTLFALMGIAAFLVWKKGLDRKDIKIALGIFIGQLVLNTLWSIIFFGLHSPGGALIEIVFLWLAILATIVVFYKISRPAAWLLVPYILWVSFAMYLNYAIWALN